MARAPLTIREIVDADRAAWVEMRTKLWPDKTIAAHAAETDGWHKSETAWGFVAELHNGSPVDCVEVT